MKRAEWVKWALLALAIGCIVFGAAAGQAAGTFRKAIYICLECMGLGV